MKNLEKIKSLLDNSNRIKDLFENKVKLWKSNSSTYDKTGFGFNMDTRFKSCEDFKVNFSSWMGVYGDSGCSSQLKLDKDIFEKHFVKYLNANKEVIMIEISLRMENEAKELKRDALKELNDQLDLINNL